MRLPVALKIAFVTAGACGAGPISPWTPRARADFVQSPKGSWWANCAWCFGRRHRIPKGNVQPLSRVYEFASA
jgi:hypothetical protein